MSIKRTEGLEGLPEQLLKDIEELQKDLIRIYEEIIFDHVFKTRTGEWYDTSGRVDNSVMIACEKLVKMGVWEQSTKTPPYYRPIPPIPQIKVEKKRREKYYWKVVSKKNNKLSSAVIYRGPFSVDYEIGKTTCPHPDLPNSKLLVFKTRKNARRFKDHRFFNIPWMEECPYDVIYKVRVTNTSIVNNVCGCDMLINCKKEINLDTLKQHWEKDQTKLFKNTPFGTIGVDSVELVERVW